MVSLTPVERWGEGKGNLKLTGANAPQQGYLSLNHSGDRV